MTEILTFREIAKKFPGVQALDNVSFSIEQGEVHCLAGQNGAGKSTLIKTLSGAYQLDSGEIIYRGQPTIIANPIVGFQMGISVIYQELDLLPDLTVGENIWIGQYPRRLGRIIDWQKIDRLSRELLMTLGCHFSPSALVGELTPGEQQMVAIAKSLSHNASILIMDEVTSSLSEHEQVRLFEVIRRLKAQGTTIIYITHKLNEIFELGDRVTVMRDGRYIGTWHVASVDQDYLVEKMIGHKIEKRSDVASHRGGRILLDVQGVSNQRVLREVSFQLHEGEVLGMAGLVGSGRTDLLRILFGVDKPTAGRILLNGEEINPASPVAAKKLGLALVPENRKTDGLVLSMSVLENFIMASIGRFQKAGFIQGERAKVEAATTAQSLNTKFSSMNAEVATLSGGNQQKVVLGKWLLAGAEVLLLDEPTRGVDVGAKEEIYRIIRGLAKSGKAIIMVSSEFPELLTACDRILVMRAGKFVGEYNAKRTTKEELMECAIVGNGQQQAGTERI